MKMLLIGGAFQGKTEFAQNFFSMSDAEMESGDTCDLQKFAEKPLFNRFHLLVKRFLESTVSESEIEALVLKRFQSGNCICVIADEIGCGVVPLEKFDRQFRECTGRILCALAKKAETVVQLQCGIPILLKGTLK